MCPLNPSFLEDAMKHLPNKLTIGIDGIPAILLKECSDELTKPLHIICTLALKTATYPDIWKKTKICPRKDISG